MDRRTDGRPTRPEVAQSTPDAGLRVETASSGADRVNLLPAQSFCVNRDFERVGDADALTLAPTAGTPTLASTADGTAEP